MVAAAGWQIYAWKPPNSLTLKLASGLDKESETRHVSKLMYCMGGGHSLGTSTNTAEADRNKYATVVNKSSDEL